MKREVEVKVRLTEPVTAFKDRLMASGASLAEPKHFEDNFIFDSRDRRMATSGRLLRVRTTPEGSIITYKEAPEQESRHKVRLELEAIIEDPSTLVAILENIGFLVSFRYQKFRETYHYQGCRIEVDETPIGDFIEVEGPPERIDAAARSLGFETQDYILLTYAELFRSEPGSDFQAGMVFPPTSRVPE